jgi:hypothetical protein
MTKVVWRVNLREALVHKLPIGAIALNVDFFKGDLCVWCLVDPDLRKVDKGFLVAASGWALPETIEVHQFLGTVIKGEHCWHVFDLGHLEEIKPFVARQIEQVSRLASIYGASDAVFSINSEQGALQFEMSNEEK